MPKATIDLTKLASLNDHPCVQPLLARRAELQDRLGALESARESAQKDLDVAQEREADTIIAAGAANWTPSDTLKAADAHLHDMARQCQVLEIAMRKLDGEVQAAQTRAREEVAAALKAKAAQASGALLEDLERMREHYRALEQLQEVCGRFIAGDRLYVCPPDVVQDKGLDQRTVLVHQHLDALERQLAAAAS